MSLVSVHAPFSLDRTFLSLLADVHGHRDLFLPGRFSDLLDMVLKKCCQSEVEKKQVVPLRGSHKISKDDVKRGTGCPST